MKKIITQTFLTGIAISITSLLNAQICFTPKTSYKSSLSAGPAVTADFNRDGKPDIAIISKGAGADNVSVLLGNGNGGFGAPARFSVGVIPGSICTADFNGDGKADLATTNSGPGTVSVLLGHGDGTFDAAVDFSTTIFNNSPTICSADFNSDGKADLLITTGFNYVLEATGNGNGTFNTPVKITAGVGTHYITTADFNRDGKPDFAVTTNNGSSNVSVLLNDGAGGFGTPTNFMVSNSPVSLITTDFNADGKIDLATANTNSGTANASVLLGDGAGAFAAAINTNLDTATIPTSMCSADFDRDGKTDLAISCLNNHTTSNAYVLKGDGAGSFARPVVFATDSFASSVVAADFNRDNKTDIALSTTKSNDTGKISVLLNCNTTGVAQTSANDKSAVLYPNPGKGVFYIKAEKEITEIEIMNIQGQTIYVAHVNSKKAEVDLSNNAKGIYFYRLANEGTLMGSGKIVLE